MCANLVFLIVKTCFCWGDACEAVSEVAVLVFALENVFIVVFSF